MPKPNFRKKVKDENNSISTYSDKKISVGDIRKTQLITTYGVGAIVDFKNDAVVISSTEDWDYSPNGADNEYHRRHLSPKRAAVSTLRYFSVRYSFLSNNCSIERFLNLGMLYPNGELRAFTKSFV